MKRIIAVLLVMVLIFTLAGCTTLDNFKNAWLSDGTLAVSEIPTTIKIGIYEPITGEHKAEGSLEVAGIELANKVLPEILGKPVELIYADNKSNMYEAETAITELMNQKPQVVIGSYGEVMSIEASSFLEESRTPGITVTCTNPLITSNNPFYFTATYTESRQGDALAAYSVNDQKRDAAAVIKVTKDDTYTALIKRFNSKMKKLTGNSTSNCGTFTVSADTVDYTEVIDKLRNSGCKSVLVCLPPEMAAEFLKQCEGNNYNHVLFLGSRNWNDQNLIKLINSSEKLSVAFVAEQEQEKISEATSRFLDLYHSEYGENETPAVATAAAYDAYMMAAMAISNAYETAENTDLNELTADMDAKEKEAVTAEYERVFETGIPTGKMIKDAWNRINKYEGASGNISYNGNNEASKTIAVTPVFKGEKKEAFLFE